MPSIKANLISCYVAAHEDGGARFLLLKRGADSVLGGTWQAVHGHIEGEETAVQAALRELAEETGFSPQRFFRVEQLEEFYNDYNDTIYFVPVFAAHIGAPSPPALSDEHEAWRWCSLEEALELVVWDNQRRSLSTVARGLSAWPEVPVGLLNAIPAERMKPCS